MGGGGSKEKIHWIGHGVLIKREESELAKENQRKLTHRLLLVILQCKNSFLADIHKDIHIHSVPFCGSWGKDDQSKTKSLDYFNVKCGSKILKYNYLITDLGDL